MRGNLRHLGLISSSLRSSVNFYKQLGLKLVLLTEEVWAGKGLKIAKMRDGIGNTLELIEGDWNPHIALTLKEGSLDDLWIDLAKKAEVMIDYKNKGDIEVVYLKDPSGNYVEVVYEH